MPRRSNVNSLNEASYENKKALMGKFIDDVVPHSIKLERSCSVTDWKSLTWLCLAYIANFQERKGVHFRYAPIQVMKTKWLYKENTLKSVFFMHTHDDKVKDTYFFPLLST